MTGPKTSVAEIQVHVVHAGRDPRGYHLPAGSTLADLLRLSGDSSKNEVVLIDGVAPEAALVLRDGTVVTVLPRTLRNGDGVEPWRATIPAFEDENLFQEYLGILKARRQDSDSGEELMT